ncbi:MAG: respiratory nitrate reductase subunit gamma [Desulfarculaceae bacterium]|nr:respiratory nitrate reductase subunit gamma [Desulfarculaceae bacterium]
MRRLSLIAVLAALVLWAAAALAMPPVAMDPAPEGQGARQCLDCHHLPNLASNEGVIANQQLCLECHAKESCSRQVDGTKVPLVVTMDLFATSRHRWVACLQCHTDVAASPHKSRAGAQCLSCHPIHGEGEINSPHLSVDCAACHHKSPYVKLDKKTGVVKLAHKDLEGKPIPLTEHGPTDLTQDKHCVRCHVAGNKVGAPNMVLPAKGLICFPCHTASFSLGSWWFGLALLVFLVGIVGGGLFYMRGRVAGVESGLHDKLSRGSDSLYKAIFSRRSWEFVKVLWFDVLWQRRVLKQSVRRWFFHSLIYLSIMARFGLALFTWVVYELWPSSDLAMALMNKNFGFVAVVNDLLGLLILIGVILAALQRWVFKGEQVVAEWQDNLALIILGLMIVLGFVAEAARLVVSQTPHGIAVYSFVAYPLARLLAATGVNWPAVYGWLWYAHGLVAALFVAYLPFGKMRHMFTAPLSLIINRRLQ